MTDATESVLITGCSSGIGRATAERFHDRGWDVYATARTPSDIEDLADQGMETLELDVTLDEDCENAVETVVDETGGIGCLVNNAGYGEVAAVEDLTIEDFENQMDVNTYGPQRLMRRVLPYMREQEDGTIVNMSSVGGRLSQPALGAYCASKFALEALSDALRPEVRQYGIDVVLVEPGPVATEFSEKADEVIDDRRGDSSPYRALYDSVGEFNAGIGDRDGFDWRSTAMSLATVPPKQVADVVVAAAEDPDPDPRYAPTRTHQLLAMGRFLPDRFRDRMFSYAIDGA